MRAGCSVFCFFAGMFGDGLRDSRDCEGWGGRVEKEARSKDEAGDVDSLDARRRTWDI